MKEDGYGGADSSRDAVGKRGADGQTVAEVVQAVAHDHHPCVRFDATAVMRM